MGIMQKDSKQEKACVALLKAAQTFWEVEHETGNIAAVKWLQDSNGNLVIFTRSEYRETLMQNIGEVRTSYKAPLEPSESDIWNLNKEE